MLAFYIPLLVSALLAGVLSAPADGSAAAAARTMEIEVLELPEGFDLSHPALDIQHQVEMLKSHAKGYVLPRLPEGLPVKKVKVVLSGGGASGAAAMPPAEYHCASTKLAYYWNALAVANGLKALDDQWCCQTNLNKTCTPMYQIGNAAAAICCPPKRCVKCGYGGTMLKNLINACRVGLYVSGQLVFPGQLDIVLYRVN